MNDKAPVSVLDWIPAPTPPDKTAACGKVTQIVEYSNGTIGVMAFYCHRWDCARCRQARKQEIIDQIFSVSVLWWVHLIDSGKYQAVRKRIARAGAKYCAVGSGSEILILTDKLALPESKLVSKLILEPLIGQYLESDYNYRHNRFRHSQGLFPKASTSMVQVHIKRKIAIDKAKPEVIANLEQHGYLASTYFHSDKDINYMRRLTSNAKDLDTALSNDVEKIVWVENRNVQVKAI